MAIPASHIVEVLPRVITAGSTDLELNGLLLVENPLISASTLVLSFPSAQTVADYFGPDSPEAVSADIYFTSFDNKFIAPHAYYIARRISADVAGWLRGGKYAGTLEALKLITDGGMTVSVDSTALSLTALDFSGATSFSDVGTIIQTALVTAGATAGATAATVTYSSVTKAFTITSGTTGADSSVSYAAAPGTGTDVSAALNLTEATGAIISAGAAAMSEAAQMDAICVKTQNFVSFTTAWEADIDEALAFGAWANANYGWLYIPYSTADVMISPDSTADMASVIKTAELDHVAIVYGSLEYAVFLMSVVASVAWTRVNGTITAAFKRQAGLTAVVTDQMAASVLESKNCNYFGDFATRNAEFVFLYPGCLSASDYGFIDPYINSIWLNNRLQVALMDGIANAGRVPYNTRGYTMIKAWMMDPINEARRNAAIEPGIQLSERQRSEVMNEAGLDISTQLWTQGYYIQVLDPGAAIRSQRGSPIISVWYTYGGAVQKILVASTAIL